METNNALARVFHTWRTAADLVEVGADFAALRQKALDLAASSETLTRSFEKLVLVESGRLQVNFEPPQYPPSL